MASELSLVLNELLTVAERNGQLLARTTRAQDDQDRVRAIRDFLENLGDELQNAALGADSIEDMNQAFYLVDQLYESAENLNDYLTKNYSIALKNQYGKFLLAKASIGKAMSELEDDIGSMTQVLEYTEIALKIGSAVIALAA